MVFPVSVHWFTYIIVLHSCGDDSIAISIKTIKSQEIAIILQLTKKHLYSYTWVKYSVCILACALYLPIHNCMAVMRGIVDLTTVLALVLGVLQ